MNIQVYTTCRQEIPRKMKRRRYLTIIQCAEIERLTGFTVKQIKLRLLKAKLDTYGEKKVLVQRLYLHLHLHLHLHLELPAPSPTLQVATSPTTWPAPAPLQHHLASPPPRTTSYQYLELHSAIPGNLSSAEITIINLIYFNRRSFKQLLRYCTELNNLLWLI